MASTQISVPANTWVQITTTDKEGSINHQRGTGTIVYTISQSAPTGFDSDTPVYERTTLSDEIGFFGLKAGENIYAYAIDFNATLTLSGADGTATIIKGMTTDEDYNVSRLKVDSQPTSYEQNHQFKIFHRFIDVANSAQIVFKFAATNPVNIQERKINLWEGGREYLVIPDLGQYPGLDAKLTEVVNVTNVNGNLQDSGLTSHPLTGVSVTLGVLTGGDVISIGDSDQFPNGDAVKVDTSGGSNKGNNQNLSSPNLSGVAENQSFYLVFNSIGSSSTSGHFYLQWEERF